MTAQDETARNRAIFQMPDDMGKRIKEARKALHRGTRLKSDCVAYGAGCADGEEEARAFYRGLMEKHPIIYGGRLASLMIDAAGLPLNDTAEASYRRGWIVGMAYALECWFYESTCKRAVPKGVAA